MLEEGGGGRGRAPQRNGVLALLVLVLFVAALFACQSMNLIPFSLRPVVSLTPPSSLSPQDVSSAGAQATLTSGQQELTSLSGEATVVSLSVAQAQGVAAQATVNAGEVRLAEIAVQSTQIAQAVADAAATEDAFAAFTITAVEATATALEATATAQSLTAVSTQSVLEAHVTETAIAQATVAYQATQTAVAQASATVAAATAQVVATQTAFPLTATPAAALVAEAVQAQQQADRRANWQAFVLNPVLLGLLALVIVVLLILAVSAYRRLIPAVEARLRAIPERHAGEGQLLLVDGKVVECELLEDQTLRPELRPQVHAQLPNAGSVNVEIVAPSEPPVDYWIAEAEQQLWFSREGPP